MALNDIWQVTDIQSVNGTRVSNVFHYRQDSSGTNADALASLGSGYRTTVGSAMADNLGTEWSSICREMKIVDITGQAFMRDATVVGPGTAVGETLNSATVAVIAKFTATGSFRGTGVSYISGIVAPYEQRNNLTTEGLFAIDAIGTSFLGVLSSSGMSWTPVRAAGMHKDPLSTPEVPLPDIPHPAEPWVLSDERVRLTKLRSRRQSTRC
ncbi:unnamed protein product [marine sediment metagenome]|uniref:Uncharacterized protein n=1 Tax=marine sediment metagenome TaxID=412755 RepID=X1AXS4_9ZZZZ